VICVSEQLSLAFAVCRPFGVWRFSRNKEECYQISIFIICATLQLPNYAIMIDYDVFENYSKSFSLKDSNDTFWVNFKH